ncbi:MAG: hypothetical protein U9P50_00915 [Patescibacteria group bacterium]|nr:hypothetical protein [Patescibacteria group bacterium]
MSNKIIIKHKKYILSGNDFTFCVTDGSWFVSHWDIINNKNAKIDATCIFGIDGVELTLYEKQNGKNSAKELVKKTISKYLEKNNPISGQFRFEFDGERFNLCKTKPKWANYDCGILE